MSKSEPRTRKTCGTPAGYSSHVRHREWPCVPCMDAEAIYQKAYRIESGRSKTIVVPVEMLVELVSSSTRNVKPIRGHLGNTVTDAILTRAV